MGTGLFDLERHFSFYGAYHSNPINIAVHMVFVWPILFTALVLLYFTPPLLSIELLDQSFLVLNLGFFLTIIYGVYYVTLDNKAGSLAALLCFLCWVGGSALAHHLGFSLAWKVIFFFLLPFVLVLFPHFHELPSFMLFNCWVFFFLGNDSGWSYGFMSELFHG